MDFAKIKLLDDHIVVLRNLIGMISQELETATAERQHLMEKMGREERKETDAKQSSWASCKGAHCALGEEFSEKQLDRSNSPTSPLDCLEGSDVAEAFDAEHIEVDTTHDGGMHFSELPTPRAFSCLEQTSAEEADPDMNNALADSDDDDTSRKTDDPDSPVSGDDDKVPRPTSSCNNADSDSDIEEEDSNKPQCWISNTIYTSNVVDMIAAKTTDEEAESEFKPLCTKSLRIADALQSKTGSYTPVSLRSFDSMLMDRAAAAARLASDLRRMKLEIIDRDEHIEFLYEKYYAYKDALKKEVLRRQRETKDLKRKVDHATSQNFIMFCKLRTAEARVIELENKLRSQSPSVEMSLDLSDEQGPPSDEVVNLDLSAQQAARSHAQQCINELPQKRTETVEYHPLQETLTLTYAQLIKAEKRGDQLQQRLEQLEKQTKKPTVNTTSLNTTSVKAKSKRLGTTEIKKPKLDLSRVGRSMDYAPAKSAPRSKHDRETSIPRPSSCASQSKRKGRPGPRSVPWK